MSDTTISDVLAWEALDSRGNPTVACEVRLKGGARGTAIAPSGASTGRHEAHELRDGEARYAGKGVTKAVSHARSRLAKAINGIDADDQETVDRAMREADGTPNLQWLGANAVLALSLATLQAAADAARRPLWRHVIEPGQSPELPMPMVNILSGGAHAGRAVDIQDVLVVPVGAQSFSESMEWVNRVRRATADVLTERGLPTSLVADEGGYGPELPTNRTALEVVTTAITGAGLKPGVDMALALDVAANQFFDSADGSYRLGTEDRRINAQEWAEELAAWCQEFRVISVEDPMAEDDWDGWSAISRRLAGTTQIVGDDLFVTNADRLAEGVSRNVANAVLVKPNQIGTVSDAHRIIGAARDAGYATVLSARSGETEETWLADLAVGWRTGQIKVGSLTRSERTAKWNRLLRLETELPGTAHFAGRGTLAPLRR